VHTVDVLTRNHVRQMGAGGRPMLFAHGFGCDQRMWRHVAPAFAADRRVVLLDYVGAGGSDLDAYDATRYGTLGGYASDVLDVCAALDLRDVVFVGHSVSAMIGVLAAIREPSRFARLVLVCPSPCYRNLPPDYHGGFERDQLDELLELMDHDRDGFARYLAPVVAGNVDRPELAAEFEASFCAADPWILRRFAETTFLSDNRADLARVRVPALVLQSCDDAIAPDAVGAYVHRHLAGSTLHRLRAVGHAPHLSAPAETVAAIRRYLEPFRSPGGARAAV
jgi:sigma-B regulation protein RsbQ